MKHKIDWYELTPIIIALIGFIVFISLVIIPMSIIIIEIYGLLFFLIIIAITIFFSLILLFFLRIIVKTYN